MAGGVESKVDILNTVGTTIDSTITLFSKYFNMFLEYINAFYKQKTIYMVILIVIASSLVLVYLGMIITIYRMN